jgi:hypothetical protein
MLIIKIGGNYMKDKKKIIVMLVCMLLIATALPAVEAMNKLEYNQSIVDRGGIFRQLPAPTVWDPPPVGWKSDITSGFLAYEDFWGITSPICDVHWWGIVGSLDDPCDPVGMTFDITFYNDDGSGYPGDVVFSYVDVTPSITATGVVYDMTVYDDTFYELYYFETQLDPCCDLEEGWISILSTGSDNDCFFGWFESFDGNGDAVSYGNGQWWWHSSTLHSSDLAVILTDGREPDFEIAIKSGFGVTLEVTNSGDETLTGIPVDIVIYGGILGKINVHVRETINLDPSDSASVGTGVFLGLGKIAIGVIADDVVEYHSGLQLLIFTIIQ